MVGSRKIKSVTRKTLERNDKNVIKFPLNYCWYLFDQSSSKKTFVGKEFGQLEIFDFGKLAINLGTGQTLFKIQWNVVFGVSVEFISSDYLRRLF